MNDYNALSPQTFMIVFMLGFLSCLALCLLVYIIATLTSSSLDVEEDRRQDIAFLESHGYSVHKLTTDNVNGPRAVVSRIFRLSRNGFIVRNNRGIVGQLIPQHGAKQPAERVEGTHLKLV